MTIIVKPRAPWGQAKVVEVIGSKGDIYKVTIRPKGSMGQTSCTCIGFMYRRNCYHLAIAEKKGA